MAERKDARQKAQEALDAADRKLERKSKQAERLVGQARKAREEEAALKAEREYLAAHPALQDDVSAEPVGAAAESGKDWAGDE